MTKVMDLFRHRSNSAVSEADKRKAVSIFCYILISRTYFDGQYVSTTDFMYQKINFQISHYGFVSLKKAFMLCYSSWILECVAQKDFYLRAHDFTHDIVFQFRSSLKVLLLLVIVDSTPAVSFWSHSLS